MNIACSHLRCIAQFPKSKGTLNDRTITETLRIPFELGYSFLIWFWGRPIAWRNQHHYL